jgi:CubicO group peptidase (beta-lactamase class C family)/transposase
VGVFLPIPEFALKAADIVAFLDFMNGVVAAHRDKTLHVILDNLNTNTPKRDRWLTQHSRVYFRSTSTYSSRLNLVECWFGILSRQASRNLSCREAQQLREAINHFVKAYQQTATPLEWTKEVVYASAPRRVTLIYASNYWRNGETMFRAFVIFLTLPFFFLALRAFSAGKQTSQSNDVNLIFQSLADQQSPGIAVLIRENGRTSLERGYGVTDSKSKHAIDSETDFRLASCTKQFTAMAIMLLVHDGKLRYDEHLTDVFPEFPEYGKAITIRNVLNHTSGLPDYESLMDDAAKRGVSWTKTHQIHDAEVLHLLEGQAHGKFRPGTQWSYSNSGYVVLGLVVAKVSGEPFQDFLRDRIFAPLRMNNTLAYVNGTNEIPGRAYGHSKEGNGFVQTDQSATSATLGDGGVYSNLDDLIKWDDALAHHQLLPAIAMEPALIPVKLADGSTPNWSSDPGDSDPLAGEPVLYGFGWFLDDYRGKKRMWHYGETTGFRTAIERFVDKNLTIVILCNRADLDPGGLASKVADLYLNASN